MASKQSIVLIIGAILLTICSASNISAQDATCETQGDSTQDRIGCLDSDGDGWSDPDGNWSVAMGADAFPNNSSENADLDGDGLGDNSDDDIDGDGVVNVDDVWPMDGIIWSDSDGDGFADQGLHELSDNCPFAYGKS